MPRPIEYDIQDFLDKTTELFWQKGFKKLSMRNILDLTGLNRHSLYQRFPTKQALYLAAVKNYRDRYLCDTYQLLEKTPSGLSSIRAFFSALLHGDEPVKCLMMNTLLDSEDMESAAIKLAKTHYQHLEKAFANNIQMAIKQGEISSHPSPEDIALQLVTYMQGLPMSTQIYGNKKMKTLIFSLLDSLH